MIGEQSGSMPEEATNGKADKYENASHYQISGGLEWAYYC